MLKIYEQIKRRFGQKIGKKRSKIDRIRENYVQDAQKIMSKKCQLSVREFDKSDFVC